MRGHIYGGGGGGPDPEPAPPPLHLPLPLGSLCSGYTALLFSGKAQLVPTLPFALALPEDSAASSSCGSLLPLSSFGLLFECYLLTETFLANPKPSSPTHYSLTHRFSTWATCPNHLGLFTVAKAQRLILLVWVNLRHQKKEPGMWIATPSHPSGSCPYLCPRLVYCPVFLLRVEQGLGLSCTLPCSQHLGKLPAG